MVHAIGLFCAVSVAWILSVYPLNAQILLQPGHFEPAPYIDATWTNSSGVSVSIWTKNGTRNETAPYLSGIFFEDIAHSGDGGIYAELVRNRAFQGSGVTVGHWEPHLPGQHIVKSENPSLPFAPVLDGWYPIGDVKLSLDLLHPLSDALQVALQVDIPLDAKGEVGFKNDGFWGMAVYPQTYNLSFYAQASGFRWNYTLSKFHCSLRNNKTGETFVSTTIPLSQSTRPVPYMYRKYTTQLVNRVTTSTSNNSLYITMDAEEIKGQTLYFDLISLFPETYKDRPNGLRRDIAEKLEEGNFKFLRFPGGNNLEGYSIARRWKWWETIGDLVDRPGRPGDWSYYNTDGLGLLDFMYWCEDMDLVPVLGVYAGFSLDIANYDQGNSTDANELPMDMMGPVLQEALDELEYLMGNTSTFWGAQRAAHGHPTPFSVPFIEIGNEDFFSHNYPARALFMLRGMQAIYPDVTYIYSAADEDSKHSGKFDISLPKSVVWDDHVYASASWFVNHFDHWDNWQATSYDSKCAASKDVYASLMEYHVSAIDMGTASESVQHTDISTMAAISHPRMLSAVAEAVYAIGWERNPNTFKLSAFAPVIQNVNFYRGTPYLMLFGANPDDDLLSVSFYQEQMFNTYQGTQTLPITIDQGHFNPLFFAAQIDGPKNAIYFKIVNAGNSTQTVNIALDRPFKKVNGTILEPPKSGDLNAFNYFNNKTAITPKKIHGLDEIGYRPTLTNNGTCALFKWEMPAYSIAVLQFSMLTSYKTDETTSQGQRSGQGTGLNAQRPLRYSQDTQYDIDINLERV